MFRSILAAAVGCLILLTGCSSLEGTGEKGYISGDGDVRIIDEADRGQPLELTGTSLTGDPVDVSDYRGEVVVINAWWSGCVPCRTEMPMLAAASDELGSQAQFLGINIRDTDQAQGLAFSKGAGATYPSIYDPGGKAMLAFSGKVSLSSTPSTVVLDPEGRIAAVVNGVVPSKLTLEEVVQELDGASSSPGTTDG